MSGNSTLLPQGFQYHKAGLSCKALLPREVSRCCSLSYSAHFERQTVAGIPHHLSTRCRVHSLSMRCVTAGSAKKKKTKTCDRDQKLPSANSGLFGPAPCFLSSHIGCFWVNKVRSSKAPSPLVPPSCPPIGIFGVHQENDPASDVGRGRSILRRA